MPQSVQFACCFLLSIMAAYTAADESLRFTIAEHTDLSERHPALSWLEDSEGTLKLAEARRATDRFKPAEGQMINPGLSSAMIWAYMPVANATAQDIELVVSLNRFLVAAASVYVVHQDGRTETLLESGTDGFRSAFQRYGTLATSFTLNSNSEADVFVRYRGANWSGLQLTLHHADAFFDTRAANDAVFFILLGGILTLVLYGAVSFTFLGKQVVVLYCTGQLAFFGFFAHLSGYTTVHLWPGAPEFGRLFSPLSVLVYVLAMAQFARVFFETGQRTPWLDKLFIIVLSLGGIALSIAAVDLLSESFESRLPLLITYAAMAITWSTLPCLAVYATWRWESYFWPLAVAWAGMATFILFMVSMLIGGTALVPVTGKPSVAVAVFFEALFFALGIALRIRSIRTEALKVESRLAKSLRSELEALRRAQRLGEERQWAMSDLADKGRLLLAAGHDTRQILGALRGYASAMRSGLSAEETKALANQLENASLYLNDVLSTAVAGSHSGGITDSSLAIDTLTVTELLNPLTMVYAHSASEKGIDLIVRGGRQSVAVDRVLLLRVLGNFVSNAIKYTSRGKVLVGCRHGTKELRFQVFDTGPGVDGDVLAQLLNSDSGAFRSDAGNEEGLGIGIGISHRLALRMGGRIGGRSEPGSGSLFELILPRPKPLEMAATHDWLILDSDVHDLLHGGRIAETYDLSNLPAGKLAIIDEHYQGRNGGRELADEMKRLGCYVVLTTYDRSAEARAALMESAEMLIYKPVSLEALAYLPVDRIEATPARKHDYTPNASGD